MSKSMNSSFYYFLAYFFLCIFFILLSSTRCAKNVKINLPPKCNGAKLTLEQLLDILSIFDIRNKETRHFIKEFFRDEESVDLFVAKITYELRDKNSYYGNFHSYRIVGAKENKEGQCTFHVEFSVRKKYPLGIVKGEVEISLFQEGERWYVEKPEYVGEIKKRRNLLFPIH